MSDQTLTSVSFIHGGGWRDPTNTHEDFLPAVQHITASSDIPSSSLRGLASIDYRLSPHPNYPQPPDTPDSELRVARHPDHISDVRLALKFLVDHHGLGEEYILVGHSAGATLALQLLMGKDALGGREPVLSVPLPRAVVGISGIYDLVGVDERHTGYTDFITSAFGSDRKDWRKDSPATYAGDFSKKWPSEKLAVLAWSNEDSLIDEPEIDAMAAKLSQDGVKTSIIKNLTGDHDDIWKEGSQIKQLVKLTLNSL